MVITLPIFLLLLLLLLISACSSASEAAMLSINKVRLRHLVEEGNRTAQLTFGLLTQLDRVIGTLLVTNNLVNVAFSAIASWILVSHFGMQEGLALATAAVTAILLLVGEITPKMFAATHPEMVAFIMVRPLKVLILLLYPFASFFTWAGRWLLRFFRVPIKRRLPLVTEEEIKVMIQMGREAGVLAEHELRMLHRIFEFSDSIVSNVMVERKQIAAVDLNVQTEVALDVLIEQGHSRIVAYEGSLDKVVGVIYARDLLAMVRHGSLFILSDLIRPVAVVQKNKRIAELLGEFQRDKQQIAIVQDDAGQTCGLVTIEDLLEEIVGEIHEEAPKRTRSPKGIPPEKGDRPAA
ncbi:MAG: HlyC/CorC family transporter [Candidatus Omnitrophica bacterium]|nr:HlyC/CorC family transporter [Candidatus Omnitrophota bacterium]MBI2174969.1 HlyC/CorC family transporter [Candidatus Omnitrophota bacterium]MBI3010029.1 HlyC/CorC family transporter [Candidatus Omnitrophota bacterium]